MHDDECLEEYWWLVWQAPGGRGTLEELIFCVNEDVYLFETTGSKNFVGSENLLPDILQWMLPRQMEEDTEGSELQFQQRHVQTR